MRTPTRFMSLAGATALAAALAACGTPDPYGPNNYPVSQPAPGATYPYGSYPAQRAGYVEYGRITNVSLIRPAAGPSTNAAGTVLGAVVGGALGNQIGSGGGRAAATILGAVGGAVVGNRISGGTPNYTTTGPVYRVTVQTDSGQFRTYDVSSTGDLRPGDRVRIENGVIYLS